MAAANLTNYEIDGDALANLREYALANTLFWALAEGHACEQASRRNAMDVSFSLHRELDHETANLPRTLPRTPEI